MELWERIARARKAAGLSQEELGVKLGVSRQAVSKWETGQTKPDLDTIILMCRELNLSADYLLLGAEDAACPAKAGEPPEEDLELKAGTYALVMTAPHECDGRAQALLMDKLECSPTQAKELMERSPVILIRNLSGKEADSMAFKLRSYDFSIKVVQSALSRTLDSAMLAPPVTSFDHSGEPKQPMGFGMTVLAVALGLVAGLVILSLF